MAGARRTSSVYARNRRAASAPDAILFATHVGIHDQDYAAVLALPEVVDAGTFNLAPIGVKEYPMGILAPVADRLFRTLGRPLLVRGRLPDADRAYEIVVNRRAAAQYRLRVGQKVTVVSSTDLADFYKGVTPTGGPEVRATIVVIGDSALDSIFFADEASFTTSAAFLERNKEEPRAPNLVVRLRPGTNVATFHRRAAAALGLADIAVRDLKEDRKRIVHATDLERTGLLLFAAAAGLAGLVLVGQALTRTVHAIAEPTAALRALGLTDKGIVAGLVVPLVRAVGDLHPRPMGDREPQPLGTRPGL